MNIKIKILILSFLIYGCTGNTQTNSECPPEGKEKPNAKRQLNKKEKELNVLKNYDVEINNSNAVFWNLDNILNSPRHDDENEFNNGRYVYAEGYIIDTEEQGPESCNCHNGDADLRTGDVHIYFSNNTDAEKSECIVVEVTPKYKKLHPNYETQLIKNKKIKIYGYLLYDYIHERNSVNKCKTCGKNVWRKTCWEIHPIVKIE